jgi:ferredoxin
MSEVTAGWRVDVDGSRCMASGACVHALPGVFDLGDDGLATVIGPVDGDDDTLRDVVAECPTAALHLVRDAP